MPTNPAIFALPGTLKIAGKDFVIAAPTITDRMRIRNKMREIAKASCVNPLVFVNATKDLVDPVTFSAAVAHAVDKGSGGGMAPHENAIMEAYDSLEGTRYRVWYSIRKTIPSFTQKDVEELVTEENYFEAADALNEALGLGSVEKKASTSGT